jgi:hypothetical protein
MLSIVDSFRLYLTDSSRVDPRRHHFEVMRWRESMLAGRTDGRHAWDDGHVDGVFGGTGYQRVMLYKAVKFETVVGIFRKTKTMRKKKH